MRKAVAFLLFPVALLGLPAALLAAPEDDIPGARKVPKAGEPKKEVTCGAAFGFSGWYRVGGWVPVSVRLENTTDDDYELTVSASIRIGERNLSAHSRRVDLPRGSRKAFTLHVRAIRPVDEVEVRCATRSGIPVCSARVQPRAHLQEGKALVVVSGPCGLTGIHGRNPSVAAPAAAGTDLPDKAEGYDGVDWVVLAGSQWGQDPIRHEALLAWVEAGGRVALLGAEALRAAAQGPLGRRIGLALGQGQAVTMPDAEDLAAFAGEDLANPSGGVLVERYAVRGAEAIVSSGGVPLLLAAGLGAGEVRIFAADPEAFRGQPGYWGLWQAALGLPTRPLAEGQEDAWTRWGGEILSGPLFHRETLRLDWIWWFLGTYLVVVVPLDFLLVRALRAWRLAGLVTLAFWASGASVACFYLGAGRFTSAVVSRIAVIDAFPAEGRVSGRSLASIYASGNLKSDAEAPRGKGSAAVVVDPSDPQAIQRSGMLLGDDLRFEEDDAGIRGRDVPVYVGTQKILEARWRGGLQDLGIAAVRAGGGAWTVRNGSRATLASLTPGVPDIPPKGEARVPAGTALPGLAGQASASEPLAGLLRALAEHPPVGMPLVFGMRRPGMPGAAFLLKGSDLPVGLAGVGRADAEAVLLRLHLP